MGLQKGRLASGVMALQSLLAAQTMIPACTRAEYDLMLPGELARTYQSVTNILSTTLRTPTVCAEM